MIAHRGSFFCILAAITLLGFSGCDNATEESPDESTVVEETPDPITLLVVGDEKIGNVIARQWAARRDGEIELVSKSESDFESSGFDLGSADVVIYPPGMLGELDARNAIQEVPRRVWNSEELNREEFMRMHRMIHVRHGNRTLALPLGAPQLTIVYNKDVVAAMEKPVPESWPEFLEYIQLIRSSSDLKDADGNPLPNVVEIPTAGRWPVQIYLAHSASMVRSRGKLSTVFERKSMEPLLNAVPFVDGLRNFKTLVGDDWQTRRTPAEVLQRVLTGETALAITWPNQTFIDEETKSSDIANIALTRLPGNNQWYDPDSKNWNLRDRELSDHVALLGYTGLIASVSQSSRNSGTGFDFIQWLSSKSINLITVVDSPLSGPFRASHLGDPARWTGDLFPEEVADQYADIIYEINDESIAFMFPRIPGRHRYLDALNEEVWKFVEDEQDAETALKEAVKKWNAITDELDRGKQRGQLRKDAGL